MVTVNGVGMKCLHTVDNLISFLSSLQTQHSLTWLLLLLETRAWDPREYLRSHLGLRSRLKMLAAGLYVSYFVVDETR